MRAGMAAAALLVGASGSGRAAEPSLESARATVRVPAGGAQVEVLMDWKLDPSGVVEVPFSWLEFGGASVEGFRAFLGVEELTVRLGEPGPRVRGAVALPQAVAQAGPVEVSIRYLVNDGIARAERDLLARVPLPVVGWPPRNPEPGTFTAVVALSPAARIFRSFPAGIRYDRNSGEHRLALPVLPSLLQFEAADGARSLLRGDRALDLAALGLFAGLAVFGWRRFRSLLA